MVASIARGGNESMTRSAHGKPIEILLVEDSPDDADLTIELPVTYPEAALGTTVEVPTPEGKVSLKIPAGSDDGKLLRLKGRGAPKLKGSGRGDLLARVRVTVPKKLSKAEKHALEELKKVSKEDPRERAFNA